MKKFSHSILGHVFILQEDHKQTKNGGNGLTKAGASGRTKWRLISVDKDYSKMKR